MLAAAGSCSFPTVQKPFPRVASEKEPEAASDNQWRSQDIADARAQHGHTTFKRTSAPSAEVLGKSGDGSEAIS